MYSAPDIDSSFKVGSQKFLQSVMKWNIFGIPLNGKKDISEIVERVLTLHYENKTILFFYKRLVIWSFGISSLETEHWEV